MTAQSAAAKQKDPRVQIIQSEPQFQNGANHQLFNRDALIGAPLPNTPSLITSPNYLADPQQMLRTQTNQDMMFALMNPGNSDLRMLGSDDVFAQGDYDLFNDFLNVGNYEQLSSEGVGDIRRLSQDNMMDDGVIHSPMHYQK